MNDPGPLRASRDRVVEYALACGVVSLTVVTFMRVLATQLASTFEAISASLRSVL